MARGAFAARRIKFKFKDRAAPTVFVVSLSWVSLSLFRLPVQRSIFNSGFGPLCVEFGCSPHAFVGFLWLLGFPPTVQKHAWQVKWTLYLVLKCDCWVWMHGRHLLCAIWLAGNQFKVSFAYCPKTSGLGPTTPTAEVRISGSDNEWTTS